MHCPKCGQQQISDETRFCSRCGFLLTGVAQVVANDGILAQSSRSSFMAAGSPRRRGVMQGTFVFLLSFLIVPLIAMISVAVNAEPFAVAAAAILLTVGGLLRVVYALMFESGNLGGRILEQNGPVGSAHVISGQKAGEALPPGQSIPASVYAPPAAGNWRDTNDLATPGSVTDNTTKLLGKTEEK